MSKERPGFFRRFFHWTGKLFIGLRWLLNLVFLLLFVSILLSLFNGDVRPLPAQAPLRLEISGVLVEERSYSDPLTQLMQQSAPYDAETPIRDLIRTVEQARGDNRITGLILDLNHFESGGLAKMSEVGEALAAFRETNKPVIAIADDYTQERYFLASYADEIIVNPMGGVMFTGFGYYGTFFSEAAEKLNINFHVFKAGNYKSAVEPFTRNNMSEASRENARDWINVLWRQFTGVIESNRGLAAGTVDRIANNFPQRLASHHGDLASLALDGRLVDHILPRPALAERLESRFGSDDEGYLHIHHKEYLRHIEPPSRKASGDNSGDIGFIVASGTILDGEQMEGAIGGDSLARLLAQARDDSSLKALVIRVDSPGGSAFASDLIRQEIIKTQRQMPVVISMGSLAASGGYWIAAGADEIWAQPATLTGSIGVFGILPTFEDSLAALGVHSDGVGTTALADFYALDRPLSEDAAEIFQLNVDNIYRQFLRLVAEGRGMAPERVAEIAEGRIWTGGQAQEVGLVDHLGDLDDAVASAARRANLESWTLKPIERPLSFQEQFLKQLAQGSASLRARLFGAERSLAAPLTEAYRLLAGYGETLSRLDDPKGVYLQCFGCPER